MISLEKSQIVVPVDTFRYKRLVGKLIYLLHTHLDKVFVVSTVTPSFNCSCELHWSYL